MSQLDKLCSPPRVRRIPASRIPVNAKIKVRRNLFGPVDHESLVTELDAHIKEINDEKKEKWGFDFTKGKPISEGSSVEWTTIGEEIKPTEVKSSDETEPLQFNTKAFSGVTGIKLLPAAMEPPQTIPTSPLYIQSVLNPQQYKKENETTPSSSVQKKRLLSRTKSKVKCKRKLYPTSTSTAEPDKSQPSIHSFYKKRKHIPEPTITKKLEGSEVDSPLNKRFRTSDTSLRTIR